MVLSSYEGHVHLLSPPADHAGTGEGAGWCTDTLARLDDHTFTQPLSAQLDPATPQLELLLTSSAGMVYALVVTASTPAPPPHANGRQSADAPGMERRYFDDEDYDEVFGRRDPLPPVAGRDQVSGGGRRHDVPAVAMSQPLDWPAESRGHMQFTGYPRKQGIEMMRDEIPADVEGSYFSVSFVADMDLVNTEPYTVQVSLGELRVSAPSRHVLSGRVYTVQCIVPTVPLATTLTVALTDRFGARYLHHTPIRFHVEAVRLLQWSLLLPSLFTMTVLLFLYAFPDTHLLPTTVGGKTK